MKQNPCRYCILSHEFKGKYYCEDYGKRAECENYKKHKEYLLSRRKYRPGEPITDLSELLRQEWVMWNGQTKHIEMFMSMPVRVVVKWLNSGAFRKAIKKESEE